MYVCEVEELEMDGTANEMIMLQIILYHDAVAKNVWRSDNEGKGWKRIQGVPDGEAAQVIEHPFNSRVVSLLFSFNGFSPLISNTDPCQRFMPDWVRYTYSHGQRPTFAFPHTFIIIKLLQSRHSYFQKPRNIIELQIEVKLGNLLKYLMNLL